MKSYIITIPNHEESQNAADSCIRSSKNFENDFEVIKFDAVTPDRVDAMMKHEKIEWEVVDKLDDSVRGDKGFGSTGV